MPVSTADVDLIDRLSKPAISRVRDSVRKELQRLTSEAAGKSALGSGRFHLLIAETFVDEHQASGRALWECVKQVLGSPGHAATAGDADQIKQLLLDRIGLIWKQLEVDLEKALKPHRAMGGHLTRLNEAHRLLLDELYAEVDLYLRQATTSPAPAAIDLPTVDELTQIPDRKALTPALAAAFADAPVAEQPVSIAMVDVDKFKSINDSHGHPKGDEVLAEVAGRLSAGIRHRGQVFRYGGEEFLLLLRNASETEAVVTAERLRIAIESQPCAGLNVTVSIGVATAPQHASAAEEVIKLADAALYDAKNRGRNLVRLHGDPAPDTNRPVPTRRQPVPGGLSEDEAQRIRQEYFATLSARCPRDGAILSVNKMHTIGAATPMLFVRCDLCGMHQQI